jgi:hypothetical protein
LTNAAPAPGVSVVGMMASASAVTVRSCSALRMRGFQSDAVDTGVSSADASDANARAQAGEVAALIPASDRRRSSSRRP